MGCERVLRAQVFGLRKFVFEAQFFALTQYALILKSSPL